MTNKERLIEAEKEFQKALASGDVEQIIYSLGYLHGAKYAANIQTEHIEDLSDGALD